MYIDLANNPPSSYGSTYEGAFNKMLKRLHELNDNSLGDIISIPTDATTNDYLSKVNQVTGKTFNISDIVAFYNKYPHSDSEYFLFSISADDIVRFMMADGCTNHARAMMAVVRAALPDLDPKDLRYVITSLASDYNSLCSKNSARDTVGTINGHQVAIMKINGVWYDLNSSSKSSLAEFDFQDVESGDISENVPIKFFFYPEKGYTLIRYIGADYTDYGCDSSFNNLMNASASGCYKSNICNWSSY